MQSISFKLCIGHIFGGLSRMSGKQTGVLQPSPFLAVTAEDQLFCLAPCVI